MQPLHADQVTPHVYPGTNFPGDGNPGETGGGLPWEWFDLGLRTEGPPDIQNIDSVETGGWRRDWRIQVDGRIVPFKVLRRMVGGSVPGQVKRRPALLLVHGMGLTIASFRGVAEHLLATHDLILPDYSGFSRGGESLDSLGMKAFVRSLWRIADALRIDHLSLGGNSLGGGLCLAAAVEEPGRVDRMVLANPACFPQELPRMYRLARIPLFGELLMTFTAAEKFIGGVEYIGYVDKQRFEPELRRRYITLLTPWENRLRLMRLIRFLPAGERDVHCGLYLGRLAEIRVPVLITWGLQDPLLVAGRGERLAGALPNALYEAHSDLSHMPHEEAPGRVGRRWSAFLNEDHQRQRGQVP